MATKLVLSLSKLWIAMLAFPLFIQCDDKVCIPGIGSKAPAFEAKTTQGTIQFPGDYAGKWVILFSHPADFTPVCETEFRKFAQMVPKLKAHNTELVGLSTDSEYTHEAWLHSLNAKNHRKKEIKFPIIADHERKVAYKYGMIHSQASADKTVRSVFIIDPKGIMRAILYYPITNGRSFKEIERLLLALQTSDSKNVITGAEWQPGDKAIPASQPEHIEKKDNEPSTTQARSQQF